jgi:ubiquinone/menaquinone biosynthesis C-methylase UbiE
MTLAPETVKACCADVYSSGAARFLLGDSFHPGGAALTSQLIHALRVGPGDTVVDVACGPGASAAQLARERGCRVIGIDLVVPDATPDPLVRFVQGDAEALPLDDASVDGALCECALCTFPDKPTAVRELARVLRPGARVAIADVTAEPAKLPDALRSLDAWVACIGDARPLDEVTQLLRDAAFEVEQVQGHDDALAVLLDKLEGRLRVARLVGDDHFEADCARALPLVAAARAALFEGNLGYDVIVARRP